MTSTPHLAWSRGIVPVNADAPEIEAEFVDVRAAVVTLLGVKGVTGHRVRDLPIRIERLL
jgi:CO/xanthine dehydrogenase Mo-binding subunit